MEFSSYNIEAFNSVCEDSEHVRYYSIGAKKSGKIMSALLKEGHSYIVDDTLGV